MAGYSGTPLAKKLGVKDGHRVLLIGAPEGFEATLSPLPEGVEVVRTGRGKRAFDVVHAFVTTIKEVERAFDQGRARMVENGGLWISWPKKASGVPTEVTETIVRTIGLASGLVDNKVCAVDEVWSGLRFVVRLKDRAKG